MRSIPGRSVPSATIGAALVAGALALGSLAGCSAGTAPDTAAGSGTGTPTSAAPVATAPPSSVTVDTTEVATDPEPEATATTTAPSARPGGPQAVMVTTSYAGVLPGASAVEAGGYVDVVELGGTCTLTLTRGDATRTATAEATPDATTTACGGLEIPLSDLGSGTWEAVLGYESGRAAGEASPVEVEVP